MCLKILLSILCLYLAAEFCVGYRPHPQCVEGLPSFPNKGTYFTNNGTYDTNRRLILPTFASNVSSRDGYYNVSIGEGPGMIYALGMCIPGVEPERCSDCIQTVSNSLLQNCLNETHSFEWGTYKMLCLVRYSDSSFFDSLEQEPVLTICSRENIGDITEFNRVWADFMEDMIVAASSKHYAAKVSPLMGFQRIYAMMQCIPGLSSISCGVCLRRSVSKYEEECKGRQGTNIRRPACFFEWKTYPFYDAFGYPQSLSPLNSQAPQPMRPPGELPHATKKNTISRGTLIASVTVAVLSVALCALGIAYCICRRNKSDKAKEKAKELKFDDDMTSPQSSQFDFKTLEEATNKFSGMNKIGQGGFGEVYKGKLPNGMDVAIKRLSKISRQGLTEFKNEVVLIIKLQHMNLVRLLGYSVAGDEKLLIYEYMSNKSLDVLLFDSLKSRELDWETRMKIVNGTTRGLQYLHEYSRLRIIHRDLKASNILLDDEMNPKISDFGTARIFGCKQIDDSTQRIVGTFGYMSPEYALGGIISEKSDIYSFGVLLLEIISGKKATRFVHNDQKHSLIAYAWESWCETKGVSIIDEALCDSYSLKEVMQCVHIALLCVQDYPKDRPTISQIIYMLSNDDNLPIPTQPTFSNVLNGEQQLASSDYVLSINEATQTALEGR